MAKSKAHFEQIPVEVVKKIIEAQAVEKKQTDGNDDVTIETPPSKTEPSKVRPLCRKGA